ncbi:hypothetical protein MMC17_004146 [Xylographa soralifera]|nr:hypothetical protein [Xylographa soralifera]
MSIFLTSHIVRRIATALFYSGNKFVLFLNGIDKWRPYQCSTSLRSPLAQFIKALPKEALPHLRRVVLTFLGLDPEEFLQDERKVTEWEKAIDLLDREVNLPKLTLVLDIDEWYLGQDPALSKAQHLDIYMRILQPLIRIRGIRNFFVFLKPRALYGREIACILEKSVVGPEYDAVANGKPEERRRRWNDGYCYEPVFGPDGRMLSPTPPPPKPWESSSSEDEGQYW